MSWNIYHSQSEQYASQAELAHRHGDEGVATDLYRRAAEAEVRALESLDHSKVRTLGVTAVSAVSLWFKAQKYEQAQVVAFKWLGKGILPPFAIDALRDLLQAIWNEEARREVGVEFAKGEVLVSVSGGEVVRGGALLGVILRKVDEFSSLFYRTIEMMLKMLPSERGEPPSISESSPSGDAEYVALREEILRRLELQYQGVTLALLSTGTLITVALQVQSSSALLVYPILALFLFTAWANNGALIDQISIYIRDNYESVGNWRTQTRPSDQKNLKTGAGTRIGWEHHVWGKRATTKVYLGFGFHGVIEPVATVGIFLSTQVLTLILAYLNYKATTTEKVLFAFSIFAVILTVILILIRIIEWRSMSGQRSHDVTQGS
jgi:hypothetical protein